MADEDFWNESKVKTSAKTFSFDDRESGAGVGLGESGSLQMCGISLDGTSQLFQQVKAGLQQSSSSSSSIVDTKHSTELELHQLVSERTLNCFLESDSPPYTGPKSCVDPAEEVRILRRQLDDMWKTPDPAKTVRRMMMKQPFILELFRSLESKKKLLEEAVALGDGDAITMVVIFLSKTLKRTYFNQILLESPTASAHYVAYLSTRVRTAELTDLLEMLGKNQEASMKQFEIACQNPQRRLQRLTTCAKNHNFDRKDAQILDSYIKFLEWQAESKLEEESVIDCLSTLCEKHWGEGKGVMSPSSLCQLQGVSDKQYQWTAITARAKHQAWQDIETFLTTKSWLRGVKLRVSLPLEHVVTVLHSCGAPQHLLHTFLQLIDNLDKRLVVARAVNCEKAILEASITMRDKPSFRASLPLS